jgi:hypothetical protein
MLGARLLRSGHGCSILANLELGRKTGGWGSLSPKLAKVCAPLEGVRYRWRGRRQIAQIRARPNCFPICLAGLLVAFAHVRCPRRFIARSNNSTPANQESAGVLRRLDNRKSSPLPSMSDFEPVGQTKPLKLLKAGTPPGPTIHSVKLSVLYDTRNSS